MATAPRAKADIYASRPQDSSVVDLRTALDARMQSLDVARYSWWIHWRELADYMLPRRYRWLVTPNAWARGRPINQNIIDSTATIAARILASGMMSGITSPSRPWFRLTITDDELNEDPDVKVWLDEVHTRMLRVMAASNYYTAKATQYLDLAIFGTAPMIIYEDHDSVIRCYNPCAGEYYAAAGARFSVDTLGRKITMTVSQVVDEFGLDACSDSVKQMWKNPSGKDQEIVVSHLIEPDPDYTVDPTHVGPGGQPRGFKFRECYWEWGSTKTNLLRERGFYEQPFSCPRWDTNGNDAYGRSPGMDALGDVKQLQLEQKRKAQAIDKMVNPPMVADVAMKNEPASLLPGGVTYVPQMSAGVGFKPVFEVNPRIGELMEDIKEVQDRIRRVFFNDIFLMISQLDTVRTATEIDARREEQLVQLGPVLERFETEGLSPDIDRVFHIMGRKGLFPAMPQILRGAQIKVEYVSMLSEAQRATSLTSIERLWGFAGSVAAARPDVLDNLDEDESIDDYADKLRVSPKIMRSPTVVAGIRKAKAQAAAQQQAMQQASAAVQGAQVLSQTQTGAGQNALDLMLGGAAARPGAL